MSANQGSIVYASPKQSFNFVFEVLDGYKNRVNSLTVPIITRIFDTSLSLLSGYPKDMTNLDIGLYSFSITMPMGPDNLGSFIADITWTNPDSLMLVQTFYQIISRLPPSMGGGYFIGIK